MARDYKKRSSRRKKKAASPWKFMAAGFAMGAVVAILAYRMLSPAPPESPPEPVPAAAREPQSAVEPPEEVAQAPRPRQVEKDERFTFYDLLPNFEVVIPETEEPVQGEPAPRPIEAPGAYVLQAGSFQSFADADRRKAELALQGVESHIQKVTIDEKTWHRVRVGPILEVSEVNDLRTRIRMAGMDVMLLKVAE